MIGEERTITIRCIGIDPKSGREIWAIRVGELPAFCELHFEGDTKNALVLDGGGA